jgi:hypothetical protein
MKQSRAQPTSALGGTLWQAGRLALSPGRPSTESARPARLNGSSARAPRGSRSTTLRPGAVATGWAARRSTGRRRRVDARLPSRSSRPGRRRCSCAHARTLPERVAERLRPYPFGLSPLAPRGGGLRAFSCFGRAADRETQHPALIVSAPAGWLEQVESVPVAAVELETMAGPELSRDGQRRLVHAAVWVLERDGRARRQVMPGLRAGTTCRIRRRRWWGAQSEPPPGASQRSPPSESRSGGSSRSSTRAEAP